jgi:hypothetical protein
VVAFAAAIGAGAAAPAAAQLSAPCEVKCAVVLGVSSYTVGTAAMVAWGRSTGGVATGGRAAAIWLSGATLAAAGGLSLGGDGARQERAVYASGIGLLVGGLAGSSLGWARAAEPGDVLAMSLIGAGFGSLIGGVIGALTYEAETSDPVPVFMIRIPT